MMKIVIIGGVAAGAKAATKARRLLPEAEIDLYTQDTHVSYSACGLPYYIEGNFEDYRTLLVRSPEEFGKSGINVYLKHKVTKILPQTKQVLVEELDKPNAFLKDYDKLIIATGARPFIPNIKHVALPNVFTLRTIEDGIAIRKKVENSKSVVIIGGGYIGLELLEACVKQGLNTTLIERGPHIMPLFDPEISQLVKDQLMSISEGKFNIITNENVTEFVGDNNGVSSVKTASGLVFQTDFVIVCAGIVPNVEIALDAGIALGETGAIKVTKRMETNISDIYACGDCVEERHLISETYIWMPLGSNANKEGRCAAMNACGFEDEFAGVLGSAVTRCLKLTMSMTGLSETQALALGFSPVSVIVTKYDKVGYMPDANNITLKIVADKKTGRLLGGQGIGAGDADKRINTLATALLAKLTVKEFFDNDLTYSPAFSPTIDPLLNAAQILLTKVDKAEPES